jgi:hypothetical protein
MGLLGADHPLTLESRALWLGSWGKPGMPARQRMSSSDWSLTGVGCSAQTTWSPSTLEIV